MYWKKLKVKGVVVKKLVLGLIVSLSFIGFGVTSLSASVIKEGIILASAHNSGNKCGSSKKNDEKKLNKCAPGKCGEGKCGGNKEIKKIQSNKCGGEKKPKRAVSGSCGQGKCG